MIDTGRRNVTESDQPRVDCEMVTKFSQILMNILLIYAINSVIDPYGYGLDMITQRTIFWYLSYMHERLL